MSRFFGFGQHAVGIIAIGQEATGVIAIGQAATGVVAIGQLARGGIAVGQLAFGVVSLGQLGLGLIWCGAMLGISGYSGGGIVFKLLPKKKPGQAVGEDTMDRAIKMAPRFILAGLLAVAYVFVVGQPLLNALFQTGGPLGPGRPHPPR
jgi:hypothetical protein